MNFNSLKIICVLFIVSNYLYAEERGYYLSQFLWQTNDITVCWENPTAADKAHRDLVQKAVIDSWGKYSKINFIGWSNCQESTAIKIRIHDGVLEETGHGNVSAPHTISIGTAIATRSAGMVLNFSFKNWSSDFCDSDRPSKKYPKTLMQRQYCIKAVAIHEFGHALGIAHEQDRPDTPFDCTDNVVNQKNGVMVGSWDESSIMNYCNPDWLNEGMLSPSDIETIQEMYGARVN